MTKRGLQNLPCLPLPDLLIFKHLLDYLKAQIQRGLEYQCKLSQSSDPKGIRIITDLGNI